jgi:hypothetical protein
MSVMLHVSIYNVSPAYMIVGRDSWFTKRCQPATSFYYLCILTAQKHDYKPTVWSVFTGSQCEYSLKHFKSDWLAVGVKLLQCDFICYVSSYLFIIYGRSEVPANSLYWRVPDSRPMYSLGGLPAIITASSSKVYQHNEEVFFSSGSFDTLFLHNLFIWFVQAIRAAA